MPTDKPTRSALLPGLRYKVFVMGKFTFDDFLKYIEKCRVTEIHAVPRVLVVLQKMPQAKDYGLSSVNICLLVRHRGGRIRRMRWRSY